MMVEYLRAAGIKPSVALATALFYGVKVDTQNFQKQNLAGLGRHLLPLPVQHRQSQPGAQVRTHRGCAVSELRYFRTALNEVKASNRRAYVHLGKVGTPDILVIIADFLIGSSRSIGSLFPGCMVKN